MAIVTKKIGPISAYAIAKEEGYTGTKEQFAQEIGNAAANAQAAAASATAADGYATSAATSASNAMSTTPEGYNSMMASIAAEYDATATYAVGDYCRYNSEVYCCVTAVSAAEAFDSTKWTKVTIGGQLSQLSEEIALEYDPAKTYVAGEYARHDGNLYRARADILTPEAWTLVHWAKIDSIDNEILSIKNNLEMYTGLENAVLSNCKKTAVELTIETGSAYAVNGDSVAKSTASAYSSFRCAAVTVVGGTPYAVSVRRMAYPDPTAPQIVFADGNNKVVSKIFPNIPASVTTMFYVTVPFNATQMLINSYGSNPSVSVLQSTPAWNNQTILYFSNGGKPTFSYPYGGRGAGTTITITLPDVTMGFVKPDGSAATYSSSKTPRSWDVVSGQVLVWDVGTNTISAKARADVGGNDVVMFTHIFGVPYDGLFLPFFNEIYGDGIRSIQEYVGIPWEYDTDYISGKISEIREKQIDCGRNMFAFVSDSHNVSYRQKQDSPKLIRSIARSTGLNKVVCGGDWIYATGTEAQMYEQLWAQIEAYKSYVSPYATVYNIVGNHDVHITDTSTSPATRYELTTEQVYNTMFADMENKGIVYPENDLLGMYYYFDSGKIRYMCINAMQEQQSGESAQYENQVAFFRAAVASASADKKFVWITHIPMIESQSINYDYATNTFLPLIVENKLRTVAVFAGHNHRDQMDIVDGIVHISINADAVLSPEMEGFNRDGPLYTPEAGAFDVACINVDSSRCDLIRVGEGANRAFTFGTNPSIITLS